MTPPPSPPTSRLTPFNVAMLYALISVLWIIGSGELLSYVVESPHLRERIELTKGLVFVAVTSGLLYLLLKGWREPVYTNVIAGDTALPGTKRLVLIFIALVLVVPLIGMAIVKLYVPQTEQDTYRNLEVIARLKVEQIENWLHERRGDCEVLAGDDAFAARVDQFVRHGQDTQLAGLITQRFDRMRDNYHYSKILLLDTRGGQLLESGDDVTSTPVAAELWQQALADKQVHLRPLYRDEEGHVHLEWAVPIVVPESRGGRVVAVALLRITAQSFIFPLIKSWPTASASGEILMVSRDGENVLFLNQLLFNNATPMSFSLPLASAALPAAIAIRANRAGTVTGEDYRNVPVLAAYRPVAETGWHVVAKIDRDEVLKPVWDMVYWVSLVVVAAITAIMVILLRLWRQQQRTLRLAIMAQSAAATEESERRFRAVAQSANDAIITTDSAGNVVGWNPSAERLFGYTEAEIAGQPTGGLVPERYRELHRDGLARVAAGGEQHHIGKSQELVGLRKDGSEFPLEISIAQWSIDAGVFFTALIRDITQRKLAEQKLSDSEKYFRSLFENMLEGYAYCKMIFEGDVPVDFIYVDVNQAFETLTGLKEVTGKNVSEVIPGIRESNPELFEIYGRVALTGQAEHFENYVDVLKIWFSISVYCPEKGFFVAVFDNITQRKQMALALAEKETRLRTLVETIPDLVWAKDVEGVYLSCNPMFERFFGAIEEDIIGKTDYDFVDKALADSFREHDRKAMAANMPSVNEEWVTFADDGHKELLETTKTPMYDAGGKLVGVLGIAHDITERKLVEEKLRRNEEILRLFVENSPVPIAMLDREMKYIAVSRSFNMDYGLGEQNLVGRAHYEIFPEISERWKEIHRRCLAGSIEKSDADPFPRADGTLDWVRWEIRPWHEPDGKIGGIIMFSEVITERKRTEESLRKLSLAVEQSPSTIVITDLDAKIEYANAAFVKATGYTLEEAIGQNPRILQSSKTPKATYDDMWAHLSRGEVWKGELINRRKDGGEYIESVLISPVRQADGSVTHYLAVKEDITQFKQAQEELRVSREDLRRLLDSMAEGVYGTDTHGNCTFVNRAFLQMLGYDHENEFLGKHIHELIHHSHADGSHYPSSECKAYCAFRLNRSVNVSDEVFWHKDGTAIPVEYWSHTIESDGAVLGAIVTFIDITERKRMELDLLQLNEDLENKVVARTFDLERARQEAEQANRAKSDFLSTMSHEIRTPMNGVIGMVDVLQQSSLNGPQIEMTSIIHDSAFALLSIIDDILDFSKIESGRLQIENVPMSVADVVESACVTLSHSALKKEVELMLFTDPGIPSQVLGDPGRLRQILINLAGNAIKFSSGQPRPGKVSVRTRLAADTHEQVKLEFIIADNGIGMDDATLARLFTPFSQADSSTTRTYGGTGLGLAISRQLANIMGGEISVHSEPDQGSTFCVHLTFKLLPEKTDASPNLVAGLHCLVVGDAGGMEDDLASYLVYAGAEVEREAELAKVKQWIATRPPGLCIVLIDSPTVTPTLNELRGIAHTHPEQQTHFVVIRRGKRREPRFEESDIVSVDGNVLSRKALLKAVAVAAGREQVTDWRNKPGLDKATLTPPSREEALRLGRLMLIAEDNEINQKVIRQQLNLLGRTADIASNGSKALALWRSGDYALLLTDLHMPEMDGYELTAAIRAAETGGRHMPIIAFTANALKGEADRCSAVGMDDYLSKPVQLANLKAMLEKWMPAVGDTASISNPTHPVGASLLANPLREQARSYNEMPDSQAVDVNVLKALIGDDEATLREFLHDFRLSVEVIAAELRAAYMAGQVVTVAAQAHKLKSSARAVGALALAELCAGIEKSGKAGETETLARLMPEFERELANVERFLEAY